MAPETRVAVRSRSTDRALGGGFTLVEGVAVVTIIAVFLGALGNVTLSVHQSFLEASLTAEADNSLRRLVSRLVSELRFADPDSVAVTESGGTTTVAFTTPTGWDNGSGTIIMSTPRTVVFTADRVLVDGGVVAEQINGLTFTLTGNVLSIAAQVDRPLTVGGVATTVSRSLLQELTL